MEKKFKWPKFLTVKRTILFAVLILAVTILLVYFLGGYKEGNYTSETKGFNPEDSEFVSYTDLLTPMKEEVTKHNSDFSKKLVTATKAELAALVSELKTIENKDALLAKLPEIYKDTTKNVTLSTEPGSSWKFDFTTRGLVSSVYGKTYYLGNFDNDGNLQKTCDLTVYSSVFKLYKKQEDNSYKQVNAVSDITIDGEYIIGITAANAEQTSIYFNGAVSGDYLGTTNDITAAATVKLETSATNAKEYYPYVLEGANKKYISIASATNVQEYNNLYQSIDDSNVVDNNQYAIDLLDEFEFVFKNDNYAFYFNYRYTSFKIDSIRNGNKDDIINTWYSNPQLEGNDPNSSSPSDTRKNHASPIVLNFLTKAGAIKRYTAYEYAISDVFETGIEDEPVTPSFKVKTDTTNNSVLVYYELYKKGTTYNDYPKFLAVSRINELVERSKNYVQEELDKLAEYYEDNNIDELFTYVKNHKDNTILMDYTNLTKTSFIGLEAYKIVNELNVDSTTANKSNYNLLINSISTNIESVYELACEMVRVEYLYNYKADNGFYIKDDANLRIQYPTLHTEIVVDEATGEEIDNSYREFTNYTNMKTVPRKVLSQILYTRMRYTEDDLASDLAAYDVENTSTNAKFKVAIEYKITEKGLTATVLNDSIYESHPSVYPLYNIEILPYFTSEICEVEKDGNSYATYGDIVIPDGSGALIELNNGKQSYTQYSKRVYSTDLAFGSEVKLSETEDILLPMYAITSDRLYDVNTGKAFKNSSAIIARVSEGAAQASISANVSLFTDSFNKVYFTTTYRESQLVTMGTGYYAKEITKFTEDFVKVDTVIDYYLFSSDTKDYDYADMALEYRKILEAEGVLNANQKDTTDEMVLNAELLGVYDFTTNFLGIVYSGHDTLTNYEQAITILEDLKGWGATNINLLYRGWRDSGFVNETFKDMSYANKLGSKKEQKALLEYLEKEAITLYPITSFIEINEFKDSFGKTRYSTRDVSSEYTEKYPYDLAGNVYDKKQNAYFTLSPKFYNVFAEMVAKNYTKKNPELHAMAFEKLGGALVGDYNKRGVLYKNESVNAQIDVFETLAKDDRINDLSLKTPYEFAVKYANNITEVPYESTLYEVFNYSIPFYQLVFSGYKDYSGLIINANDEINLTKHLMNIFLTGSNVQFTFSYDNSSELIQTVYNYYYYTQHEKWESEVTSVLSEVAKYQLHKYQLGDHEVYRDSTNQEITGVYVVTYIAKNADANGVKDSFKVYLNYSEKAITLSNGKDLPSWNYYVDKEVK